MAQEALYLSRLVKAVATLNGDFLEIGSWHGRSTVAIGREVKKLNSLLYCIDIWNKKGLEEETEEYKRIIEGYKKMTVAGMFFKGNSYFLFTENIKKSGLSNTVIPIIGLSSRIRKTWENPLRFIFIDGNHEAEYVRDDSSWKKFLIVGGIIAFHDYRERGVVKKPVDEEMGNDPDFETVGSAQSIKAFRRLK